jgi:hypothetical protein
MELGILLVSTYIWFDSAASSLIFMPWVIAEVGLLCSFFGLTMSMKVSSSSFSLKL